MGIAELFWPLLGLGVLAFLFLGPILLIVLWTRVRSLEEDLARIKRGTFAPVPWEGAVPQRPAPPQRGFAGAPPAAAEPVSPAVPPERPQVPAAGIAPRDIRLADEEPGRAAERERARERAAAFARTAPTPLAAQPPSASPPAAGDSEGGFSWEELLAGKWLTWVGALALVLGAGLFLKYTIEHDYIGQRGRLAIGFLVGMSCYAGGAYAMLRRYDWLGQGVIGAALGILYFTLFAGFYFYDELIPQHVAFAGMVAVTASSLAFSAKFDAPATAVLGLIGGLATPLMLSKGIDARWALFSYLFVLNAGVLGIASFRKWQFLNVLAFAGTVAIWIGWFTAHFDHDDAIQLRDALVLMTAHFALFALLAIWHNVLRKISAVPSDFFLVLAAPVAYFAGLYHVTREQYDHWHGPLAVGMAAVYLALGLIALYRDPAGRKLVMALGGVAVSFLTLAVPLQFTGHWVAIAWAVQSVVLFELGLRFREPKLERAGFAVLGIVLLILAHYTSSTLDDPAGFTTQFVRPSAAEEAPAGRLLFEVPTAAAPAWTDVVNGRSLSFLAAIAAMGIIAWECRRRIAAGAPPADTSRERAAELAESSAAAGFLLAAVPVVLLAVLLVESFAFSARADWLNVSFLALASVWTSAVAVGIAAWGGFRRDKALAYVALCAFGLLAMFLTASAVQTLADWRWLWQRSVDAGDALRHWRFVLLNPRGLGFAAAIAAAAACAWAAHRAAGSAGDREADLPLMPRQMTGGLVLYAWLAGWLMFTVEIYAYGIIRDWGTRTALAITAVWTLYATGTLVAGIVLRAGLLRMAALGLFVLTTAKVFLYDVWEIEAAYRTFAFIGLGAGLLLASWMYRRYRERIRSWMTAGLLAALVPAQFAAVPQTACAQEPASSAKARELLGALSHRWPVAPLPAPTDASAQEGLAAIRVPAELYARARGDLGDMRVLTTLADATDLDAADAAEIPFVLHRPRDRLEQVERPARMLNLSHTATTTEFLLDRDDRRPTSRISIDLPETERNFVRTVKVYGADATAPDEWKALTETGYLFDRTDPARRLRIATVDFPATTFGRLRVVIENGEQPPLAIQGARLHLYRKIEANRRAHPCRVVSQSRSEDGRRTHVVLDAGHHGLPVIELALEVEYAGNFARPVAIEAGDGADRPERVAWQPVGGGDLLRIDRPDLRAEDTLLELPETPSRWFRLTITDGDDRPLEIAGCAARSLERYLVVERGRLARKGRVVAMYSGSRRLSPPSYDLARTQDSFDLAALPVVEAGPVEANPLYGGLAPPGIPWSERHQALLWTITIAGVVALGAAAFLLLKRAARHDAK